MFIMNKINEYNYVRNQVNIQIRIRIRDIRFALYLTISESVSVSELKYGKKYYPDPIPYVFDPIPSLLLSLSPLPLWLRSDPIVSYPSTPAIATVDGGLAQHLYCTQGPQALLLLFPSSTRNQGSGPEMRHPRPAGALRGDPVCLSAHG